MHLNVGSTDTDSGTSDQGLIHLQVVKRLDVGRVIPLKTIPHLFESHDVFVLA